MSELTRAVSRLVTAATENQPDSVLRATVDATMQAFDAANATEANAAIRILGDGIANADGRADQVLHLALGALVEAGASPDAAWKLVGRDLPNVLAGATRFAKACVELSGEEDLSEALGAAAQLVARKMPADAAAWSSMPARCLSAVACLLQSRSLRRKVRKTKLASATYALEDAVSEVGLLSQVLQMLDGESFVVLHPESRRGFRVVVRDLPSNVEFLVLLTDALVGDPKKGLLAGKPLDKRVVALLRKATAEGKKSREVRAPFDLFPWTMLGAAEKVDDHEESSHAWLEATPAQIPPFKSERIILLRDARTPASFTVEPTTTELMPEVVLKTKLPSKDVDKWLATLAKAAEKARKPQKKTQKSKKR